jgi:hypothetical protein
VNSVLFVVNIYLVNIYAITKLFYIHYKLTITAGFFTHSYNRVFLTLYFMSILQKMAIFIEKPPVTSSNCYETM